MIKNKNMSMQAHQYTHDPARPAGRPRKFPEVYAAVAELKVGDTYTLPYHPIPEVRDLRRATKYKLTQKIVGNTLVIKRVG